MLALAGAVGLRFVRYLPVELPAAFDYALGVALIVTSFAFLYPLLVAPVQVVVLLGVALAGWIRPASLFAQRTRPWRVRPWFHALVWVELMLNHYLFDLNPYLAVSLALALVAFEIDRLAWGEQAGRVGYAVLVTGALATLAIMSDTAADATAGAVLAVGVLWVLRWGKAWCGSRERRVLVIAGGAGCQLLAAFLPLIAPGHGGTRLDDGLAYSFCEAPGHAALFAAIPEAPTMRQWTLRGGHGSSGYVAEYDAATLALRARHRFFSETFHGRIEYLLCLDDSVQVGMTNVTIDGRHDQDHAMSFPLDDPSRFERDLLGGGAGHGIAHDAARDALFYVSENKPILVRVDGETGARETVRIGDVEHASLVVGLQSVHRARDALYVSGWLNGRDVFEVDLATLAVRRVFPHRNGGAHGITVDEELDRLYSVGLWGMEVFDLETGALVARKRLGMLGRAPAIDTVNDLLYVPSTVEGKIRVLDRKTLELRGALAIGHGPRIPYYSPRGARVFSSSSLAHYYWEADALAARFRSARPASVID